MRENTMTRAELNKAILKVLKTQFKKDAPESFKAVESAGFKIEKWNGTFAVVSDNGKCAKLEWHTYLNQYNINLRYSYNKSIRNKWFKYYESCPIDFVGYFESDIKNWENPYKYNVGWCKWKDCSKAVATYYTKIYDTKCDINQEKRRIKEKREHILALQKQIDNCMNDIERYYKNIAEYEKALNRNRLDLGLDRVY